MTNGFPQSRTTRSRMMRDKAFLALCVIAALAAFAILWTLLSTIVIQGFEHLNMDFLRSAPSRKPEQAGIMPAMVGTVLICLICAAAAIPIGVGTAILLEEFKPTHPLLRKLHGFIQTNITNLAGVPSIVYGILGLTAFANMFGVFGGALEPAQTVGQRWYDQYQDEGKQTYFVEVDVRDASPTPAIAQLALRDEPGGDRVSLEFRTEQELRPAVDRLEAELAGFEDVIKRHVGRTPRFDRARAEAVADEALAVAPFQQDTEQARAMIIEQLLAMDGLTGYRASRARRGLVRDFQQREYTQRFAGVMVEGKMPVRVDRKAWWYAQLPFGRGVLVGGLTLMLVVLPIVIIASQEAIRAVPDSMRQGTLALGATRWQTVRHMSLLAAVPGIMTGTILAMSRAIGEAAPILILGGVIFITFTPTNLMDNFTAMPLQIYNWSSQPQAEFHKVAATGIIVLLAVLLSFNALAVFIRQKFQKPMS